MVSLTQDPNATYCTTDRESGDALIRLGESQRGRVSFTYVDVTVSSPEIKGVCINAGYNPVYVCTSWGADQVCKGHIYTYKYRQILGVAP